MSPNWKTFLVISRRDASILGSVDNALGIWLVDPDPAEDHRQWTSFVSLMQDYYGLEWIFEERSDKVNYMDMTIVIREDRIVMSI